MSAWLRFLRNYGPIPRNDNMYDETIQRSARRQKIAPIEFEHPMQDFVLQCFDKRAVDPVSVILTGTAGDGKTHLCRQVWKTLNGDEKSGHRMIPTSAWSFLIPRTVRLGRIQLIRNCIVPSPCISSATSAGGCHRKAPSGILRRKHCSSGYADLSWPRMAMRSF